MAIDFKLPDLGENVDSGDVVNVLVKEGQNVVRGQKIAEIGNTDSPQAKLHFEIRRLGKPVDPLKLLPARPS